jgi:hypothetical protein
MAYQKLQVGLGLEVIPTDGSDIPNPAGPSFSSTGTTGTSVSGTALTLVDAAADFIAERIAPGMVIYNTVDNNVAVVTSITGATTLMAAVKNNSPWTETSAYTIYHETTDGCVLYAGGVLESGVSGLDLTIVTSSGSEVQLQKLLPGSFLPIQVRRVKESGTDTGNTYVKIVAFW